MSKIDIEYCSEIDVECVQQMGGDWSIIAAAKVSVDPEEAKRVMIEKDDDGRGLIKYLMRSKHGCYDSNTEVLTMNGWIPWPEVKGDELFCTLNQNSGLIEYQKAIQTTLGFDYSGPMYKVKGTGVNLLVTSNHNMYCCEMTTKRGRKKTNFKLMPAYLLGHKNHCYLKTGKWEIDPKRNIHFTPNELALIGFSIGDGHLNHGFMTFHLKKIRKIQYLQSLGFGINMQGNQYAVKWPFDFNIYNQDKEKIIPKFLLINCNKDELENLLDGLIASDGHIAQDGKITYTTTSKKLADQIQQLCLHCDKAAHISIQTNRETSFGDKTLYVVSILQEHFKPEVNRNNDYKSKTEWIMDWKGKIYCVTVPNGTLYVRRNGIPVWCGNSPFEHSSMSFYVDAPIFVWREWHRHRIGTSYNEESGRWSQLRPKFYIPSLERPMMTSEHYKPSKPILESMCESMYWDWIKGQKIVYQFLYENYVQSLNKGIAKEVARMILPVGIYSRCWVTLNPRSLMHFLSLRTHDEKAKYVSWPQHEIELAARSCEEALKEYWPITYEAFNEYGRVSP